MSEVNWGMIGCGDVTEVKSGPALQLIKDSNLVAVTSRTPTRARDYARRHNVPYWYDNIEKIFQNPEINAIYVATPPNSHAKYAIKAAEAGKHVYVEKPMGLNYSECKEMIRIAKRNNVLLFVAYYRRALPSFVQVKEWIDNSEIGAPRFINIQLVKPLYLKKDLDKRLSWRFQPEISGGGLFVDLGSHQLDYLDFLLGPIQSVKGFALNQAGEYSAEDLVTGCFSFPNNVLANATWCFSASKESAMDKIEIIGSKGKIVMSTFGFTPLQLYTKKGIKTLEYPKPKHVQRPLIQTVVNELLNRGKCPSTGITASRTNRIMDELINASGGQGVLFKKITPCTPTKTFC